MKQTQKDIKYIIKRILIGVGIIIVISNLKKCNVYALDRYTYLFSANSGAIQIFDTQQTEVYLRPPGTNIAVSDNLSIVNSSLVDDLTIHFGTYSTYTYNGNNVSLLHFIYDDRYEVFMQMSFNTGGSNYQKLASGNYKILVRNNPDIYVNGNNTDYLQAYVVPTVDIDKPLSEISDKTQVSSIFFTYLDLQSSLSSNNCPTPNVAPCNALYTATTTDANNNTIYFGNNMTVSNFHKDMFDMSRVQIIDNFNNWLVYNGEILESTPTDPLANLTKVDLTGYQSALIVPKSYEVMLDNYSDTTEVAPGVFNTFLNMSFYTQYCTRQTLTNLTNTSDLIINNLGTSTGSLSASISGTCPSEPTETIMSYQYDMYTGMIPMGILIYNNEIIEGTYDTNIYGTSYIWYDANVYDIYLVEDITSFSEDITFIDYTGDEKTIPVQGLPSFEDMAQYALLNSPELNKTKINGLLGNVKLPFSFLNKIAHTRCQALRFPFPNSEQIIIIPCMSDIYNNFVNDNLINTISLIINGLLVYRCIISLIDVSTSVLDADDDKLEVLDL